MRKFVLPGALRGIALAVAVFCLLVPNGYFIYHYTASPVLMQALLENPLGQAFLAETVLLLMFFLSAVFIWRHSLAQVLLYWLAALIGGLAFAFPLFIFLNSEKQKRD